jgi:hypothetical protein
VTALYSSLLHTHTHTHTPVPSHVFVSRCLVAASNGGRSPSCGFPNGPRPQLSASNRNSSRQNRNSSLTPESGLLYDWRFTANQFVLAPSPLRITTKYSYLQLNLCSHRSRDSDWLRTGRSRGRSSSSSPSRVKNFLFSAASRPALESTQPPI